MATPCDPHELYAACDLGQVPPPALVAQLRATAPAAIDVDALGTGRAIFGLPPELTAGIDRLDPLEHRWAGAMLARLRADDYRPDDTACWPDPLQHPALARATLAAVVAAAPTLVERYRARGVGEASLVGACADVRRWIAAYHRRHGHPGLREIRWLRLHFAAELIPLGRLQFNPIRWHGARRVGTFALGEGQAVFATHIPADGRLDPDQVDASFAQAARELPRLWPDRAGSPLTCVSWLLDPQLPALVGSESNLARFQRRWPHLVPRDGEDRSIQAFAFDRDVPPADPAGLRATTSLQRAILAHYAGGRRFTGGIGVRV